MEEQMKIEYPAAPEVHNGNDEDERGNEITNCSNIVSTLFVGKHLRAL